MCLVCKVKVAGRVCEGSRGGVVAVGCKLEGVLYCIVCIVLYCIV